MSNVKAGDIGVIRGLVEAPHCNGMLVTVLEVTDARWWVDPLGMSWGCGGWTACVESLGSLFPKDKFSTCETRYATFHVRNVAPIRDPGDDARDESLTWLPSPSREREAA